MEEELKVKGRHLLNVFFLCYYELLWVGVTYGSMFKDANFKIYLDSLFELTVKKVRSQDFNS